MLRLTIEMLAVNVNRTRSASQHVYMVKAIRHRSEMIDAAAYRQLCTIMKEAYLPFQGIVAFLVKPIMVDVQV
jgi:hypothetical protein